MTTSITLFPLLPRWRCRPSCVAAEEDNLRFFERFMSGKEDYSTMLAWLKVAIEKLPAPLGNLLVFNTLTRLRRPRPV
jgi:hypothetical protein